MSASDVELMEKQVAIFEKLVAIARTGKLIQFNVGVCGGTFSSTAYVQRPTKGVGEASVTYHMGVGGVPDPFSDDSLAQG